MHQLEERGARVMYRDPWVPVLPAKTWPEGHELQSVAFTEELIASDCVAILTDHRVFDYKTLVSAADLLLDTRNATRSNAPHVSRLGAS